MTKPSRTLRLILGDHLSLNISSLSDCDREHDVVLIVEVMEEATYVQHHPKKIVFVLSAMRHFAAKLRANGYVVHYVCLDDPLNTGTFSGEVERAISNWMPDRVVVTEPGEFRIRKVMDNWNDKFGIPVQIRNDDRFVSTIDEFSDWANSRKSLRMEYFYREMRKKTGLLMDAAGKPEGGEWNYDSQNRKRLPKGKVAPVPANFEPDTITNDVIALVNNHFPNHFGELNGFCYAVTSEDAELALDSFINTSLAHFGDYQDAMAVNEPFLFHSLISAYLNIGLLDPIDVCRRVEDAWKKGLAPLNSVEGFIRQIIGWREYVRGIYWTQMPAYAGTNFLDADRPLPDFYWSGETELNCLAQVITQTREHAYAHHIQRLMVTGNFAVLLGVHPEAVNQWYLEVFVDAFEWVQMPNTHGMALFADGGIMASKPYVASGKYVDRMSDYCKNCCYDPNKTNGEADACPFNYLYWDFLMRNEGRLRGNPRLGMPYRNLDKMAQEKKSNLQRAASEFIDQL